MNSPIDDLIASAAELQDQSETVASVDFAPPAAGPTVGRFIEYIEYGKQKQKPYQGKPKPDAQEVRLTFELLAPKNIKEIEIEGGGKKEIADRINITLAIKLGDKAAFKKLFTKMTYGRNNIKHMAQMLGEAFVLEVLHNKAKEGDKIYANIRDAQGEWKVSPPFVKDPISGNIKKYNVPPAKSPIKIFLWANPTKETWDSLFIDGTREVKEGDVVKQVSKNWLQERILGATDYKGSKLEDLITKVDGLSIDPQDGITETDDEIQFDLSASDVALAALEEGKPETTAEDDLAAIGL